MGNHFSSHTKSENSRSIKRPFVEDEDCKNSQNLLFKKRRRSKSTSQYIYNALFVSGQGSDVIVEAFNKQWKLHKVYLKQAEFFSKMFDGQWKESNQKYIKLEIPDKNVNEKALNTAFGFLYSDDIEVLPKEAKSILAAASLIQLEGLMQSCSEVMVESVCSENVCDFYESARLYGQKNVEQICVEWLENNLMIQSNKGHHIDIDPVLMCRILNSSNMFVVQVEMDVYTMLRKWVFFRLVDKPVSDDPKNLSKEIVKYFRCKYGKNKKNFLESEEGKEFVEVFRSVRLCNIVRDYTCCREIEVDGIIPLNWIIPVYRQRWLEMLKVEQGNDRGPNKEDCFDMKSLRCGRRILCDVDHCWRWNGYNFGVDLLISYNSKSPRSLMLKRNVESHHCVSSVGMVTKRNIIYHLRVFSLDDRGHVIHHFDTKSKFQTFSKDEERLVLRLGDEESKLDFPLMVSATFKTISDPSDNLQTFENWSLTWPIPT